MKKFIRNEDGFLISTELVLIATIAVLGLLAGIVEVRDQVFQELGDFSQAVAQLDQTYVYNGVYTEFSRDAESDFTRGGDYRDSEDAQAIVNADAGGISVNGASDPEPSTM